jgi:hypothetical protein
MTAQPFGMVRFALFVAVCLAGVFTIVATGGPPVPPPTIGAISVSTGFGGVSNPPYQCTGGGKITISPISLTGTGGISQPQSKAFSYSGYSSTTPPACEQTTVFTGLDFGTWRVTDGIAVCTATVSAVQTATVRIWSEVCQ